MVQLASQKPFSEDQSLDAEVLILGAGISGISAAKTLNDNGITDFIILEAEDRIGGRMKSKVLETSSTRVELGANWIQGIDPTQPEKHPIWKIAQKCGGLDGSFVKTFSKGTMHVFNENGKNISNSTALKERVSQWNKILDPGLSEYSIKLQNAGLPDVTMREALSANGWIPTTPLDNLIEWSGSDGEEYCVPPKNVSLFMNFPDETYTDFGDPNLTVDYFVTNQEEGFEKVVRCLSEDFLEKDDKRLILSSVVMEVDWSNSEYVCVTVKEKDSIKKYCASYAILTFSIGVLQSDVVKFIPPLPTTKRDAINKYEYVLFLKIFLEFEEEFWRDDNMVDNFRHVDSIRGHFVIFLKIQKSIPVLFTIVTSEVAKMVYKQSVSETTSQIMKVLRNIYGESTPEPVRVTIPDWGVNPFYYGMFSATPLGVDEEVMGMLSQPVGRLHFGGEATSQKYFGFLHGGYFSGINTANEIIKLL